MTKWASSVGLRSKMSEVDESVCTLGNQTFSCLNNGICELQGGGGNNTTTEFLPECVTCLMGYSGQRCENGGKSNEKALCKQN